MNKGLIMLGILVVLGLACSAAQPATETPAAATATLTPLPQPAPADTQAPPSDAPATATVTVYFTVSDPVTMHLQPVPREIPVPGLPTLLIKATLDELLRGPNDVEKTIGLTSWFGPETEHALTAFILDGDTVIVDFHALSDRIPNASTSAGSVLLLSQLNATIFQFPFIQQITYQQDGSCAAFWEWLQYECHPVTRAAWQAEPAP